MDGHPRLIVTPYGSPARHALWEVIDAAKRGDPLCPVTVTVPSPLAGLALRRGFTRGGRRGFANVRFTSLSRVAELLGEAALAATGRRPLTASLRAHAVRSALDHLPGPLAGVRHHAPTARAIERSVLDLCRAGAGARSRVAGQSKRAAAIVALADHYAELTRNYFDGDDVLNAAAEAVDAVKAGTSEGGLEARALADVGRVVIYLPIGLSPAEERLVAALARAGRAFAVVGTTGDDSADRSAREIAGRLGGMLGVAHVLAGTSVPHATRLLHAGDPDDEVRAVVRQVVDLAATRPLHRIGVLYRQADPYSRLLHSALDAASVTWNGPSGRRLADSAAGHVLLGLLRLSADDLERNAVTDWLASGPILDPADGREVPAHRFDRLSREAGIVRGLDQWTARLAHLAERLAADRHDIHATGEPGSGHYGGLEADLAQASRLATFVSDLHDRLAPPVPASWPSFSRWAHDLLEAYVGDESIRSRWPAIESDAARRVLEIVDGLSVLADIDAIVDAERFRRAIERELDTPSARHGRFGEGVFTGPIGQATATDFDTVFVVGLTEGAFPPRGKEDPLLPDRERAVAGDALPLQSNRRAEERRTFLAALSAADESVLTFPRSDPREQRPKLPARWLLESASALAGEMMGAARLFEQESCEWLTVIESFESATLAAAAGDGAVAMPEEHDLGWMLLWQKAGGAVATHPLLTRSPELAGGIASAAARRSNRLTAFDGMVGPRPDLAPSAHRPISPTALQTWAECPRRYLFERVLRVSEVAKPEEIKTIAAIERGTLVHEILERLITSRHPGDPSYRWTDSDRAELMSIASRLCDDAESRGVTGAPLLWKRERRRVERIVMTFLETDELVRSEHGVAPIELEKAFGMDSRTHATIDLDGRPTLAFKGRIDRVDESPDRSHVVVFDYKTGKIDRYSAIANDPVDGGRFLQLPIYALAVQGEHPAAHVDTYYWFVEQPRSKALVGYTFDAAARRRFVEVLGTILDGISAGVFPAAGRQSTRDAELEGCNVCIYNRACPPGRARRWLRKQSDPAASRYLALSESTPPGPDDSEPTP